MNVSTRRPPASFSTGYPLLAAAMFLFASSTSGAPPSAGDLEFFESKVRPVLTEHCHGCHGPEKQESGLRLDHGSFVRGGGDGGPVIDGDRPADSRLLLAISHDDPDFRMPPKGKLPEEKLAAIREWVQKGGYWPDEPVPTGGPGAPFDLVARRDRHWCWKPIVRPSIPGVRDPSWPAGPIDQFLLARLEEKNLRPAAAADRRTILRRLSFDLLGLPPDPSEIDAFVDDPSPNATERLVDRLLASPAFGERWARHWLDLVRYAESYGHEFDYPIAGAHEYRDYLLRAFNADLGYDRMVLEHVAGDLVPPRRDPVDGTIQSIAATGFWFFHEQRHGPIDVRLHHADRLDNQAEVFGKMFLGLTVGCARCHDHKFDAISMKDVYGLWGFLASSRMQFAELDPGGRRARAAEEVDAIRADASRRLRQAIEDAPFRDGGLARLLLALETVERGPDAEDRGSLIARAAKSSGVDPEVLSRFAESLTNPGESKHPFAAWFDRKRTVPESSPHDGRLVEDFSRGGFPGWYAAGEAFGKGPTRAGEWDAPSEAPRVVEAGLAHSGLAASPQSGALRSRSFVLEDDSFWYRVKGRGGRIRLVVDGYHMNEFNPLLFADCTLRIDNPAFEWRHQVHDIARYKGHRVYIEIEDPGDGWIAVDEIRAGGRPIEPKASPIERLLPDDAFENPQRLALAYQELWDRAVRDCNQQSTASSLSPLMDWAIAEGFVSVEPRTFAADREKIDRIARSIPRGRRTVAIADGDGVDQPLYRRGKTSESLGPAPRRFLEAIAGPDQAPMPTDSSGRRELARWVLDRGNPLTARVMVNRIWHHLFGRGIVASVDNFGVQGQPPTHPELLDYLADVFRTEQEWSTKRLVRSIVLSRGYQMSSVPSDASAERIDPANELFHRREVRRLEGEAIRDSILAASGRLDRRMYGRPVPIHLTPFMEGRGRPNESGPEDGAGRRSLYIEVRRNFLHPMFLAFDLPAPYLPAGRRTQSNVPAQALFLMNNPFVHGQAKLLGRRALAETSASVDERIAKMFLWTLSRPPAPEETAAARTFLVAAGPANDQGAERAGSASARDSERAWADLAHVLFNLKEFLFVP